MSYEDVLSVLDHLFDGQVYIEAGPLRLITDYQKTLRRYVVKNEELLKACRDIYLKHKGAFDLVQKTIKDEESRIREKGRGIIQSAIHALPESTGVYLCDNSNGGTNGKNPSFRSKRMDHKLPNLLLPTGSWGNHSNYYYWFCEVRSDDRFLLCKLSVVFGIRRKRITSEFERNPKHENNV